MSNLSMPPGKPPDRPPPFTQTAAEPGAPALHPASSGPPPLVEPGEPANSKPRPRVDWLGQTDAAVLFPSPATLEAYAAAHPDAIEKILAWTDAQLIHHQALQQQAVERWETFQNRAQLLTASIAALGLVCAAVVGVFGNPVVASVIALASIGGPTTAIALARLVPAGRSPGRSPDEEGR